MSRFGRPTALGSTLRKYCSHVDQVARRSSASRSARALEYCARIAPAFRTNFAHRTPKPINDPPRSINLHRRAPCAPDAAGFLDELLLHLLRAPRLTRSRRPQFIRKFGRTMMRVLALLCAVCGVASEAVNLTPDNFEKEVTNSGKSAFIKFLAPW